MQCLGVCADLITEAERLGFAPEQIARAFRRQKRNKVTNLVHIARSSLKAQVRARKRQRRSGPLRKY